MGGELPMAREPASLDGPRGEAVIPPLLKCLGGECISGKGRERDKGRENTPTTAVEREFTRPSPVNTEQDAPCPISPCQPPSKEASTNNEPNDRHMTCTDDSMDFLLKVLLDDAPARPQRIQRVWGNWGEYTLDPKWRKWALDRMGVGDLPIHVDLFAEPWSAATDLYITRDMDAFSYDWGPLQEGSRGILWANPPFRQLT